MRDSGEADGTDPVFPLVVWHPRGGVRGKLDGPPLVAGRNARSSTYSRMSTLSFGKTSIREVCSPTVPMMCIGPRHHVDTPHLLRSLIGTSCR